MKKIIKIILISSLAIFLFACGNKKEEKKQSQNKNLNQIKEKVVKVEKIRNMEIQEKSSFSNRLEAKQKVDVSLERGGTVKKIYKTNGSPVKKGDLIVSFKNENLRAEFSKAQSNLQNSNFQYKLAKNKFEKFKTLYNKQLISYLEFSNYEANYINSKENYKTAKAYYLSLKKVFDELNSKATINGTVGNLFLKEGNEIVAGKNIFTILNSDEMEGYISVPAQILSKIKVGDSVSVEINSLSKKFLGKIIEINPIAEKLTKNFKIKISIDNKNQEIKDSMFATFIISSPPKSVLVVPKSAILVKELISYVFINEDGIAKQIEVKTGISNENYIEVISKNLKENDLVITEGLLGLQENEKLTVKNKEAK